MTGEIRQNPTLARLENKPPKRRMSKARLKIGKVETLRKMKMMMASPEKRTKLPEKQNGRTALKRNEKKQASKLKGIIG